METYGEKKYLYSPVSFSWSLVWPSSLTRISIIIHTFVNIGLVTRENGGAEEGGTEEGGLMEKIRADLLTLAGTVSLSNICCFGR